MNLHKVTLIGEDNIFTYGFKVWCTKDELDQKVQEHRENLLERGMQTNEIYSFKTYN